MLQLEETKQIKLDLNSSKYNKLKVLETKIISIYVCGPTKYQPIRTCPAFECRSPETAPPKSAACSLSSPTLQIIFM